MTIATKATYAVLFSVAFENKREADRLVLMRRFLEGGLGPDINLLHEAVFPEYSKCGFLLVVEATCQDLVEKAVSSCAGVFHTNVLPVVIEKSDPTVLDAGYGLFAIDTKYEGLTPGYRAIQPDWVKARLHLTLPAGFWCTAIWLVSAPSIRTAVSLPAHEGITGIIEPAVATPMKDFFLTKMGQRPQNVQAEPQAAEAANLTEQQWTIYNEGPPAAYVDSDFLMPFTREMSVQKISSQQAITVKSTAYLWKKLQADFEYRVIWGTYGGYNLKHQDTAIAGAAWAYPDLVLSRTESASVGFDLGTLQAHLRTELYFWLNDLMNTSTFNKPWPEDSYDAGRKAAYQYILSQIPGQTPPQKGTIKEPTVISLIQYPNNAAFTSQEFKEVQDHLLVEIDHFRTVDRWFGPNGIVNAISEKIGIVSSNDLTEAVQLMTIPPQVSGLVFFLDNIFNMLSRLIGIIPVMGGAFSALISIGWSVARLAMGAGNPGQPVNVPIADMADKLNEYLEAMANSAQQQLNILYGDFGKLEEFSKGVIEGKISPNQFYPDGAPPNNGEGPTQLPQEFLQAAANAWLLIIYQHLFANIHTVQTYLNLASDAPNSPQNPAQGGFAWWVPCRYQEYKSNPVDGYLVFESSTDAPAPVLQQLFGPNSRLNVNPIEFYAGLNGWPRALPQYYGPDGTPMPVLSLGIWSTP